MKKPFSLYKQMANTEHGVSLSKNIRFGPFKPDYITPEQWEKLLGPDVNNLKHMHYMINLCDELLSGQNDISEHDKKTISITASIHDWAEAVVGDIPDPLKTKEDEIIEQTHLSIILAENNIQEQEHIISTLFDKECSTYPIFRLCEVIGYFLTAIKAWKKHKKEKDILLKRNLYNLARNVFKNNIDYLTNFSERGEIKKVFLENRKEIMEMYAEFSNNRL